MGAEATGAEVRQAYFEAEAERPVMARFGNKNPISVT